MDFRRLIEYDSWANERVFKVIGQLKKGEKREKAERLFSHILGAQSVWILRIEGSAEEQEVWPDRSTSEMKEIIENNNKKLHDLISRKEEYITYQNSKGHKFENKVEEILLHLTIHGQHHRAQIATLLREGGIEPPATDFIYFLREDNQSQ